MLQFLLDQQNITKAYQQRPIKLLKSNIDGSIPFIGMNNI